MTIPTYDAPSPKVLKPATLAHVVLRTADIEKMSKFYVTFLGGQVTYSNEAISFITYDEEHHRIALIGIPEASPKAPHSCGLEHIAFTFSSLEDLLLACRQRKSHGIDAVWCVNHGPTTSIYYKDPDGNMLETQVDNFDTVDEATAFMKSSKFAENPIGTDFNPDDLISAINEGVSEETLKKRKEIGPREMPDLAAM
ncbi:hypothetical protein ACHAPT_013490 [Fusarium lateritium]